MSRISGAWKFFINQIKDMGVADILDILIVSVLIYYVYLFIRERRAGKLATGLIVLLLVQVISSLFGFPVLGYFMSNVLQIGLIAAVIIFQPELRSILESVGGDSIKGLKSIGEDKDAIQRARFIDAVCEAANEMSMSKTGALMVIERSTKLGDIISTGTVINADSSSMLLRNIFFNKSPLHDGAVVIRDMRIYAAGCLLPLATKNNITKELGTRHRAAIGVSEASDAIVIVVSEETGTISVARRGRLIREYDSVRLKSELERLISENKPQSKKKNIKRLFDLKNEKDTKRKNNSTK
ncbi:MAG: TIGR00159 family protein [Ruminococcaceae bacterium]|nr:TIGR00159 family protein [Oscillospiraceae bacterium]